MGDSSCLGLTVPPFWGAPKCPPRECRAPRGIPRGESPLPPAAFSQPAFIHSLLNEMEC